MTSAQSGSSTRHADPDENPYVEEPPTDFDPVDDLSPEAAAEQADLLRAAVREHDHRYYVAADPLIADEAYDRLFARLEALEDAFDLPTEDSPTRRVGGEPLDELATVEHVAPMLSIDNDTEADAVRAGGPAEMLEIPGFTIARRSDDGEPVAATPCRAELICA